MSGGIGELGIAAGDACLTEGDLKNELSVVCFDRLADLGVFLIEDIGFVG